MSQDTNNDSGGLQEMDLDDAGAPVLALDPASNKKSQLPWVEKYRPDK